MACADDNLHWIMIAPDGDTVSAIAPRAEGTKLRHSHIHILYSLTEEWVDTGLYSIEEVFRRVLRCNPPNG
jgi:hypothetical protein